MMKFQTKHIILLFLFILCSSLAFPRIASAEQWKLSLDAAKERAVSENRDIQVAKQRLVELIGLKGEALSTGLPQLTGTANYQRALKKPEISIANQTFALGKDNQYTAGVALNQLLWDGGRVIHAIKAAKMEELRGLETIRDVEEKVRLEVTQTFHEILYTEKVISVLEEQLKVLKWHLSSIKTRYDQGIDSDYTLMRQEVEVSNVEPELIDAKRNKELLINGMKILLAIPQTDDFTPLGEFDYRPNAIPPVPALAEKAVANRPDLKVEKLRMRSLEQAIGMERAGWWPNLNVSGEYQWQAQTDQWSPGSGDQANSFTTAVSLSWPLFDGLKTLSRVKQAKARFAQQQFSTSQMEDNVVREVKDIHEILMRARSNLDAQRKSLDLARRATKIAGERFESGLMSQLELNDTITSQARSEQLFLRSAFDCMNAEAALKKAVGGEL